MDWFLYDRGLHHERVNLEFDWVLLEERESWDITVKGILHTEYKFCKICKDSFQESTF